MNFSLGAKLIKSFAPYFFLQTIPYTITSIYKHTLKASTLVQSHNPCFTKVQKKRTQKKEF